MKISFITTVYNEEKTIKKFFDSLLSQTKLPDEIIIVDGNSTDETVERVKLIESQFKKKKVTFKTIIKEGNRSIGRNEAIKNATGDIIVCSDSGNILDKDWLKNIVAPFKNKQVDVVAGYYKGKAKNIFQKCLIPYALVMPDKVDPDNFLPATRSVAFTKIIWKKVGGFDEELSHNEDYVFANKLKEKKANIVFAKDAIVNWIPRTTYKQAFVMFWRFAFGDAEAGILRTNVLLLLTRYFFGFYFIFLSILYRSIYSVVFLFGLFLFYLLWSIKKNYKYVNNVQGFVILPLLQLTADAAVLSGTLLGGIKKITRINYFSLVQQNKFLFFVLGLYILLTGATLQWGIPNEQHPFPYHMDEWHQLQAVANTFRYGTPNTAGSANGTIFHFLLSGFYLIPFILLKIINPFALQLDNWQMRQSVFEVLRFQTMLFGVLSIVTLYKITTLIKAQKRLAIFLFTFTPIWLMLSGDFKYDIALIFWILLSLLFFLRFAKYPTNKNYLFAAIPPALAIAVKVSAIPLLPIYFVSYFWFHPAWKKNVNYLLLGFILLISCLLLFGFPDTLFGRGNILVYLFENLVGFPNSSINYLLGMNPLLYLFTRHYPIIFGYGLYTLFLFSSGYFIYSLFKNKIKGNKIGIFIFFSFLVFLTSLLSLQLFAGGNKSLVLLPFMVLIISMIRIKGIGKFLVILICLSQLVFSLMWVTLRIQKSPQELSSVWMDKNVIRGETIGVENVPIYQAIPDTVQKEFYYKQYGVKQDYKYTYQVIDSNSKSLPSLVIVCNGDIETKMMKKSAKTDLMQRLHAEGYRKIISFTPDFEYAGISDGDFYLSWLLAVPNEIAVYKK